MESSAEPLTVGGFPGIEVKKEEPDCDDWLNLMGSSAVLFTDWGTEPEILQVKKEEVEPDPMITLAVPLTSGGNVAALGNHDYIVYFISLPIFIM
ncbi:hypothetical protein GDO86_011626 [Hymenochirus boettgeri]|uniref:Uncharacterized protein n=1 Tax=Hymenochirus boettgeri TaxID=247094 RepID=A0A8T2JK72_9PIPI|nr:hypothetical protein GDO86_011626 [Hymenochirus boettgeri]